MSVVRGQLSVIKRKAVVFLTTDGFQFFREQTVNEGCLKEQLSGERPERRLRALPAAGGYE
jgi:hypothetical protein